MRAIGVRSFGGPETFEILDVPIPEISNPDDILVRVKAFSINPGDGIRAAGWGRILETVKLPFIIGHDYAGVVSAVGENVTKFKIGDEVYGFTMKAGAAAEYVLLARQFPGSIAHKPGFMSFVDAASFPTVAHTIVESLTLANSELEGGLQGKTVLVPAGLSGTGSLALQVLKSVFGVGKLITTVSTSKVELVPSLLGKGVVDQIIDYKTQNAVQEIGRGSVDFLFDTAHTAMSSLPVIKQGTGVIYTITGKSGDHLLHDWPEVSWILVKFMNTLDRMYVWRASRWGVRYLHMFIRPAEVDLDQLSGWFKEGKVKAVIGEQVKMEDLEGVQRVCGLVYAGKGGVGKYVVEVE